MNYLKKKKGTILVEWKPKGCGKIKHRENVARKSKEKGEKIGSVQS